jgi:autotransporter-associated beta strand protein
MKIRALKLSPLSIIILSALLLAAVGPVHAQQNVFSRDNSGTGNWFDNGANPWFYQTDNANENRPDNPNGNTRNDVFIGHNNNTTMVTNGAFFQLRSLTIQSGATADRIFNSGGNGTGISLTSGLFIQSGAGSDTFNTQFGVDAGTVTFSNDGGLATFTNTIFVNGNTAAFQGGSNINVSGQLQGTGGSVTKSGNGTLTFSGSSANTYTGTTSVNGGTLNASTANSLGGTSGISVASGATLQLSGATNDRINNSATMNLAAGSTLAIGAGLSEGTRPSGPFASDGVGGIGTLTVSGTSGSPVTIDFGGPGSTLNFSSLSSLGKGTYVNILNFTGQMGFDNGSASNDRLLFATDPGFTQTDLANFDFAGFAPGATEFNYGNEFEIVPVPEPSTWLAGGLALAGLMAFRRPRRSA